MKIVSTIFPYFSFCESIFLGFSALLITSEILIFSKKKELSYSYTEYISSATLIMKLTGLFFIIEIYWNLINHSFPIAYFCNRFNYYCPSNSWQYACAILYSLSQLFWFKRFEKSVILKVLYAYLILALTFSEKIFFVFNRIVYSSPNKALVSFLLCWLIELFIFAMTLCILHIIRKNISLFNSSISTTLLKRGKK